MLSDCVPHLLKNPLLTQTPDEALRNRIRKVTEEERSERTLETLLSRFRDFGGQGGGSPEAWSQLRHAAHSPAGVTHLS